jgi:transglutaminase-like putative cysteine protease
VEDEHVVLAPAGLRPPGRRVNYRVDLEAMENDTLFFAGTPEILELRARALYRSETASYRLGHAVPQGFHYDVYSLLDDPPEGAPVRFPPLVLPLAARERYLQLPALDSRIADLGRRFAANTTGDLARARAIERHLRSDYGYALELPDREVADPLAHFLFVRRKGHCEYFASSMAVMLRSLGIPARLATGFQSGVYNPVSGLWLVRASDAHSWVEAWIPGHGWTTFDPTPADVNAGGLAILGRLALYLDAAGTFWQEWVMTYDVARQGTLAYHMEQGARHWGIRWSDAAASVRAGWEKYVAVWPRRFVWQALAWAAGLVALGFAAGPLIRLRRMRQRVERVRRGQASVADATLLYQRMLHILRRRGYQKPAWFTPTEFAASLPRSPLGDSVGEFTGTYNALRFGGHTEAAPRLSILLDRMERE